MPGPDRPPAMLTNGQAVVIDMAVAAVADPLPRRYSRALLLGALREDSGCLPVLNVVYPYLSVTHFYKPGLPGGFVPFLTAGPRLRSNTFLRRAVARYRAAQPASAFVELGRCLHLLIDMGCPVHAQRVAHLTDPYEWYVESHAQALRELPVPCVPDRDEASQLVESLSGFAQAFPADRTNSLWGHALWRLGLREKSDRETCAAQAAALIPMAAGHAAALLRLFLRRAGAAEAPVALAG